MIDEMPHLLFVTIACNQRRVRGAKNTIAPRQRCPPQHTSASFIRAVKYNGALDENEKRKLLGPLDEATQPEMKFVIAELAAPWVCPPLLHCGLQPPLIAGGEAKPLEGQNGKPARHLIDGGVDGGICR